MKYAWIASNKAKWPITLACDVLGVSASGYFEHWRRKKLDKPTKPGANRRMSDEALLVHIRAIHAEVKGEYGWPKDVERTGGTGSSCWQGAGTASDEETRHPRSV